VQYTVPNAIVPQHLQEAEDARPGTVREGVLEELDVVLQFQHETLQEDLNEALRGPLGYRGGGSGGGRGGWGRRGEGRGLNHLHLGYGGS